MKYSFFSVSTVLAFFVIVRGVAEARPTIDRYYTELANTNSGWDWEMIEDQPSYVPPHPSAYIFQVDDPNANYIFTPSIPLKIRSSDIQRRNSFKLDTATVTKILTEIFSMAEYDDDDDWKYFNAVEKRSADVQGDANNCLQRQSSSPAEAPIPMAPPLPLPFIPAPKLPNTYVLYNENTGMLLVPSNRTHKLQPGVTAASEIPDTNFDSLIPFVRPFQSAGLPFAPPPYTSPVNSPADPLTNYGNAFGTFYGAPANVMYPNPGYLYMYPYTYPLFQYPITVPSYSPFPAASPIKIVPQQETVQPASDNNRPSGETKITFNQKNSTSITKKQLVPSNLTNANTSHIDPVKEPVAKSRSEDEETAADEKDPLLELSPNLRIPAEKQWTRAHLQEINRLQQQLRSLREINAKLKRDAALQRVAAKLPVIMHKRRHQPSPVLYHKQKVIFGD